MANNSAFEQALADFKSDLKPKYRAAFQQTTLATLLCEINTIQKEQHATRRLQAVGRLKPTLEALTELGKVVETFLNVSEVIAFIWGPLKLLLQIGSSLSEAFTELLSVYENLGEELPLLGQYELLFSQSGDMRRALSHLYKGVLDFHKRALKYFLQPMWKQLWQATWKTYRSQFDDILGGVQRHKHLIVSQATLLHIQASQIDKIQRDKEFLDIQEERKRRDKQFQEIAEAESNRRFREMNARYREVAGWLRSANVQNDQHEYSDVRAGYPNSGHWFLNNKTFKAWFDPMCQTIPPLLWLSGIPGAGKTILASMVVEETQKLNTHPVVLYFFCKHGDNERDNFVSIARSLLLQLLSCSKDSLLPYYYEKYATSNEAVLSTHKIIEDLLRVSILNCPTVYIILDGIDECPRKERSQISGWFCKLVEGLPPSNPDQVRCLFASQDDGVARKDFTRASAIKMTVEDNKMDIEQFSSKWAIDIQQKFDISDEARDAIARRTVSASGGMFLLAKLISTNLLYQIDVEGLNYELAPGRFPNEINAAYARIVVRIFDHASISHQRGCKTLLTWLTCAKRPMKWREIQGAKSVDLEAQCVDFDKLRFRVDSKDLCGSLVEMRSDGTVELVHLTAKLFLIGEKHVDPTDGDLELATLCVNYLNLPGFRDQNYVTTTAFILSGYYAFLDYAVSYWARHLEACLVGFGNDDAGLRELSESLEVFLQLHYAGPKGRLHVSQGSQIRLQPLATMDSFEKLQQAVISTRKQLAFYDEVDPVENALDLIGGSKSVVERTRSLIERLLLTAENDTMKGLQEHYGTSLYKCSRLSCKYFSDGFATKEQRDQHTHKHRRPFRCTINGCPSGVIGLSTEKDFKRHMKEAHGCWQLEDEFPDDEEVSQTLKQRPGPLYARTLERSLHSPSEIDPREEAHLQQTVPGSATDAITHGTRKKKSEHRCQVCDKVFSRRFNLESHLLVHETARPWECTVCSRAFARESDCKRHQQGHGDQGKFSCFGELRDGTRWGCGKRFARRDTLANHHQSKFGKKCIARLQEEEKGVRSSVEVIQDPPASPVFDQNSATQPPASA
ncbi:hypothetical protein B0H67DRAFT_558761 [Lasiosphaeris hirsuta]|uniref:Uncharacterized protein n=1 Tax=Lasiosphaeris hirsuta TaxID=260670 RepID=A0AA39ZPK1_9PEZI|nr:hypothetical protein B0H67DRAFT_558761 [Lasiosphaeris hirsuta]